MEVDVFWQAFFDIGVVEARFYPGLVGVAVCDDEGGVFFHGGFFVVILNFSVIPFLVRLNLLAEGATVLSKPCSRFLHFLKFNSSKSQLAFPPLL